MTETHHAIESSTTRRTLLGRAVGLSVAAMVPEIIPSSARSANLVSPQSERITVGLIGHGLMGRGHLRSLAGLQTPVDRFFDDVMVMADDPALRRLSAW